MPKKTRASRIVYISSIKHCPPPPFAFDLLVIRRDRSVFTRQGGWWVWGRGHQKIFGRKGGGGGSIQKIIREKGGDVKYFGNTFRWDMF